MKAQALLERPALVLNGNWQPIQTTTVKEAIGLVCKGSAKIVEPETFEIFDLWSWGDVSIARRKFEGRLIRSEKLSILPPEVILLTGYDGIGERGVTFSRRNIFKRDKCVCQYCGAQYPAEDLTIDHVIPKSHGGISSWENCALACLECNKMKADRTPAEAGMALKKRPVKPSWRTLAAVPAEKRFRSWEKFLSKAYWDVELEP